MRHILWHNDGARGPGDAAGVQLRVDEAFGATAPTTTARDDDATTVVGTRR